MATIQHLQRVMVLWLRSTQHVMFAVWSGVVNERKGDRLQQQTEPQRDCAAAHCSARPQLPLTQQEGVPLPPSLQGALAAQVAGSTGLCGPNPTVSCLCQWLAVPVVQQCRSDISCALPGCVPVLCRLC